MHKIDKFLFRLEQRQREKILAIVFKIQSGNLEGLDVKKLKGEISRYRVRSGKFRIVFETNQNGLNVISIEFKSDNTYHL